MGRDRYKQKLAQAKWYKEVVIPRKQKWFEENGPCKNCGSEENLELHHKDPTQKESHNVWTWKEERRLAELSKCMVLCALCHDLAHTKIGPEGTLWCSCCKQFVAISQFGKQKQKGEKRKYRWECNPCRKLHGWEHGIRKINKSGEVAESGLWRQS